MVPNYPRLQGMDCGVSVQQQPPIWKIFFQVPTSLCQPIRSSLGKSASLPGACILLEKWELCILERQSRVNWKIEELLTFLWDMLPTMLPTPTGC